jgi:hypothetical protein
MNPQGEDLMSETYLSLSHSKWDCKYHVVFVPKRRRKVIFGQTRRQLGAIFHALAATLRGSSSNAEVAGWLSPLNPNFAVSAIVLIIPLAETFQMVS